MQPPGELVDHLFRRRAGQMVSTLTRILGPRHLALAEDVVQESLIKALEIWPQAGIPANPSAWLIQVAKNRALDMLRREATLAQKAADLALALAPAALTPAQELDDQLAMMFLCCHPEIPHEARVALTLKTLGGFSTAEIARAFLIRESAAAQRIVRAKRLIRDRDLDFEKPSRERSDSVLETLYLMFNEGYSSGGEQLLRVDLIDESIRLARLMAGHPDTAAPECDALVALLLMQSARSPARVDASGDLLLLAEQDRTLWDRARISEGMLHLGRSATGSRMSTYHMEAGIAAAHAVAPDFASTDWRYIADLYAGLYRLNPSPVVMLNRAVAISQCEGPAPALAMLTEIENHPLLRNYHLLHATLGRLWLDSGDRQRAALAYERALECECSGPERRFLEKQLARTAAGSSPV